MQPASAGEGVSMPGDGSEPSRLLDTPNAQPIAQPSFLDRCPLEILHAICVEALHDDSRTFTHILALPLLSRRFNNVATPLLYNSLSLNNKVDVELFGRTILGGQSKFAALVRYLGLDVETLTEVEGVLGIFADTLKACTKLTSASISVKAFSEPTFEIARGLRLVCHALAAYPRPAMREVTLIALPGCAPFSYIDIRRMLAACPSLRTLSLHGLAIFDGHGGDPGPAPTCPLDELTTLSSRFGEPMLSLLGSLLGSARSIDVRHCDAALQIHLLTAISASDAVATAVVGGYFLAPSDEEEAKSVHDFKAILPSLEFIDLKWLSPRQGSLGFRRDASSVDLNDRAVVFGSSDLVNHLSQPGSAPRLHQLHLYLGDEPSEALTQICADRKLEIHPTTIDTTGWLPDPERDEGA